MGMRLYTGYTNSMNRRSLYYTTAWKHTRERVKARDNWRCRKCGSMLDLEVHHEDTSIERFFDADACLTLCRGCHIAVHSRKRKRRNGLSAEWAEIVDNLQKGTKA